MDWRNRIALFRTWLLARSSAPAICLLVALVTVNVLWGYWVRDLTYGDTAYYFKAAALWHKSGLVDIIWSPIYAMYYGSWLGVTGDAEFATFLHRIGLVFASLALVVWIGLVSLPRTLAFLLALWWIALPIHYDTLYEVHLFGALPILLIVGLALTLSSSPWRLPLILGIAVATTLLIRNEYVILSLVIAACALYETFVIWRKTGGGAALKVALRYLFCVSLAFAAGITAYASSWDRGETAKGWANYKHALNMCQVFAFGYQQREPSWNKNPWTDCQQLMKTKFDLELPTLRQMLINNPREIWRHFSWNLSLTRAGAEVLLTNATGSENNPDYVPVQKSGAWPSAVVLCSFLLLLAGSWKIYRANTVYASVARENLIRIAPIFIGLILVTAAVIVTQRPRPSYLLAQGVLYTWTVLLALGVFLPGNFAKWDSRLVSMALSLLAVWFVPSFPSIDALSKHGNLGEAYETFVGVAERTCALRARSNMLMPFYTLELPKYLCAPLYAGEPGKGVEAIGIAGLGEGATASAEAFMAALDKKDVTSVFLLPPLLSQNPALGDCRTLQNAFRGSGWTLLSYRDKEYGECYAAFVKN